MKKTLLTLFAGVACAISAFAIPAHKGLITINQPDGSPITIQQIGDEYFHYTTTADGYTVERNDAGYFVYVQKVNGSIVKTDVVAHDAANRTAQEMQLLQSLSKRLVSESAISDAKVKRAETTKALCAKPLGATTKGANYDYNNFRGLVILVEFNNLSFSREDAKDIFTDMITQSNYAGLPAVDNPDNITPYTGSVRDYFYDNSMGKFDPEFDVYGPVQVDVGKTYPQATSNAYALMKKVIQAADPIVDFSQYDNDGDGYVDMFYVIFAGFSSSYGGNNSSYLWPHASYNYQMVDGVQTSRYACSTEYYGWENYVNTIDGIGTIVHEFSHVLGLMDEYDTDYSGSGGQSFDPDNWSVMASGTDFNYARTPASYSALQRMQAGFAMPVEIEEPGDYTLNVTHETNESFRINSAVKKEYFLFENRSKSTKWDTYLPGEGMLAYRVDSTSTAPWSNNTVNCRPSHNYYEVLRATPKSDMTSSAGDPFPGTGNVTKLTNSTKPANLLSWSGKKTDLALSGITCDSDGVIHFKVSEDNFGSAVEDFENMENGVEQAEGVYSTWTFDNATVGSYGSTKGNGEKSVKLTSASEVTISTVEAELIEEIEVAVWYPSMSGKATIIMSVSTDDGATWNEIFPRGSTTPVQVNAGSKGIIFTWAVDAPGKAMFKIETNKTCYIDDVAINYNDPDGLSDVETVKVADKAPFNVATNGNCITVTSAGKEAIEVYDAAGLLVARSAAGTATIALPGRGFYMVRQGTATRKIAL